ncbi:isoleucine--tRNA ligase [Magnetospirillum sp. UT-4]|uniref:isoleucine--tRNA ligase n=1 Tax=Magnetospirillum sp. UT-4 TaxID=2681467 RepID=UPI00137CDE08|nr:isoleucine--tRNA ligase [Magnetospirillum sp. UT-4]CAA7625352.1 Isoleucine--tRNA ligase [Magnetospirillum sp. UT-4]
MTDKPTTYPQAEPNPDFGAIERAVIGRWQREGLFERSVARNPRRKDGVSNEFVFYDGPPFANGLPHYGHLATGFVKDLIPRYQTMRGRHVDRRFGWDCHGLPAELEAERELGISGRNDVLAMGIDKFNDACRTSVLRFTDEWQDYVTRQARWVSFQDQYKTMDLTFMESVLWAFKSLWDKGLVYEGYRIVPYSWAVQTPLSNFETRLDNSYRERDDPALTVAFTLIGEDTPTRILAWTTTPWTLPSNLALCVSPDLDYAVMEKDGARLILAATAVARYARELEGYEPVATVKGAALEGRAYQPLFPYFADTPNAFKVITGDFVGADDGTGVVHIAPGFGEDDLEVARRYDIAPVVPLDAAGRFTEQVPDYAGMNVIHEANPRVIKDLKAKGAVLRHEQIRHNYPHCWRTDEPLIYMAVNSWYVAVSRFRDRMVELNQGISWTPEHVRDGIFGNWLANARDWNISRNRFWGTPIPVWRSDDPAFPRIDVYGSLDEIARDFGVRPADLHRPLIDELVRPNPDDPTGKSMMRRVPDVLDCWFESGSMPFAQFHYPFENKDRFEENFPGDFIVEYVAQTRGWFYTLMVLSTALFDRAPFKTCVCHGVVLDENHQKLSKRLRNYPDPKEIFETYGADALRWYMLSSPLMTGGDLALAKDGRDVAKAMRQVIIRFWNAYSFFTLYANVDGVRARLRFDQTEVLDRYILSKTRDLVEAVQARLDVADIPGAYAVVPGYVDALNNWYIRSRRASFWADEGTQDKQDAYDTLYTCLTLACRALAPMMPLISERIYTALTGEDSVHLTDWPEVAGLPRDVALMADMDLARDVCSSVLTIRENSRRRTRLPLKSLIVAHPSAEVLRPYLPIIADEINIKSVTLTDDVAAYGTKELKVNSKLGARIGAKMKEVLAAQRSGDWRLQDDGNVAIAGLVLEPADFTLHIRTAEGLAAEPFGGSTGLVVVDTAIYPDLQAEGWARDFVRLVQNERKNANLVITDRIVIEVQVPEPVAAALVAHQGYIAEQTLAVELRLKAPDLPHGPVAEDIDGHPIVFGIGVAG